MIKRFKKILKKVFLIINLGGPYTLFVGNLSTDTKESDLIEYFQEFEVKKLKIVKDKNFAFVEFNTKEILLQAKNMKKELLYKKVSLKISEKHICNINFK